MATPCFLHVSYMLWYLAFNHAVENFYGEYHTTFSSFSIVLVYIMLLLISFSNYILVL